MSPNLKFDLPGDRGSAWLLSDLRESETQNEGVKWQSNGVVAGDTSALLPINRPI